MKIKTITSLAVAAIFGVCTSLSIAETSDIFVSFSDFDDGGAGGNTAAEFINGTSGSAFIWIDENFNIDTGAFLDVVNDNAGVLEFTGAEVFNPDVLFNGAPFLDRWQSVGDQGVFPDFIDELNGFAVVDGTGIVNSNLPGNLNDDGFDFVDALYDGSSNGFLFARIDFDVIGVGDANISLDIGAGLVVNENIELTPSFGSATVTGVAVPEPTSAALLALGLTGMVVRRRR